MKHGLWRFVLVLAWVSGWWFSARAKEHLYEGFDAFPIGSIAAQPGWGILPGTASTTGQVSGVLTHVLSNALELVQHTNGCTATYTNLHVVYAPTNHPVVRISADMYVNNTNAPFQFGLRNRLTGAFLTFQNLGGYGVFGFKFRDNVYVPLRQGAVQNVTMFYNMANREFALDYGHSNVLNWVDSQYEANDATIHTQFHQLVMTRLSNTVAHTGALVFDNLTVETFPRHALAWWRFNDTDGAFIEQLGQVMPTERIAYADAVRGPGADLAFDGEHLFTNTAAMRQLIAGPSYMRKGTPIFTNWTFEAVFRTAPGESTIQFIDCGLGTGFNTSGCWMAFSYSPSSGQFRYTLRDAQGGTNTEAINTTIGSLPADTRWHTVAFVKSNNNLTLYVDYQFMAANALPSEADGGYQFTGQTRVNIGHTLNYGNGMSEHTVIDEARLSTTSLTYPTMLQPGQPIILATSGSPGNPPWRFITKGVLGWTCVLERAVGILPNPGWTHVLDYTNTATFSSFNIPPDPPTETPVYRLRRK